MTDQSHFERASGLAPERKLLFWLALLAFILRALWVVFSHPIIQEEGVYYARMAENLVKGKLFVSVDESGTSLADQPLYTVLIAVLHFLGLDSEVAGRLISMVFGSLLPLPVAVIASRMYGRQAGLLAATLIAFFPFLVGLSVSVLPECTYLFLMFSAICLMFSSLEKPSSLRLACLGMVCGLAYLTRVEGIMLPFLASIYFFLSRLWSIPALIRNCALLFIPFLLVIAPYLAFVSWQAHGFNFEGKTASNYLFQKRLASGTPAEEILFKIGDSLQDESLDSELKAGKIHVSATDKIRFVFHVGRHSVRSLADALVSSVSLGEPFLFACVVLGMFGSPWTGDRLLNESLLLMLVGFLLLAYFVGAPIFMYRHVVSFLVLLIIWGANGASELAAWAGASFGNRLNSVISVPRLKLVVYAAFLLVLLGSSYIGTRRLPSYDIKGQRVDKEVGAWIKSTVTNNVSVMDTQPIVAYYSGLRLIPFPYCSSSVAIKFLDHTCPSVVILRTSNTSRPYLQAWVEHGIPDPRANLIRTMPDFNGGTVEIYRWNPDGGGTSARTISTGIPRREASPGGQN